MSGLLSPLHKPSAVTLLSNPYLSYLLIPDPRKEFRLWSGLVYLVSKKHVLVKKAQCDLLILNLTECVVLLRSELSLQSRLQVPKSSHHNNWKKNEEDHVDPVSF